MKVTYSEKEKKFEEDFENIIENTLEGGKIFGNVDRLKGKIENAKEKLEGEIGVLYGLI